MNVQATGATPTTTLSSFSVPVRPPELAELETLVACASEGTLAAAAERLGISRPAVAKRIANLEALAGCSLLHRSARGVTLSDDGAKLLSGARRLLQERDALVSVISEMRLGGASPIDGLRRLIGQDSAGGEAGRLAETRLAETERVLACVLRSTTNGVALTNPETAVMYEVNDAFCRFAGRSRDELIGRPSTDYIELSGARDRNGLVQEALRHGIVEGNDLQIVRPDGSVAHGRSTVYYIALGGQRLILAIVDDVGDGS